MIMPLLASLVYIGCYTDKDHPNGLHAIELDANGALVRKAAWSVEYPVYLAGSADGRYLYTTTRGGLAAFDTTGGGLRETGRFDCGGTPCHVALMPDGRSAVWADYGKGTAGSVAVDGGRFVGPGTRYEHHGKGPNLPRQDRAHCHQAMPTPDGKGFCVVDLGLDALVTYPSGQVFSTTPAGAGPRHLVFHPNGRMAFVAFELGNLVASCAWEPGKGFTRLLDQRPTLKSWPSGRPYNGDLLAAIRMSPDQKRVIVSNRGEQSLVSFDIDPATGKMALKARSPLPGSWPRDFVFVTERLAVATMEKTGEVHALAYDANEGTFRVVSTLDGFFRPVAAWPKQGKQEGN